jgi:hypothetical protein
VGTVIAEDAQDIHRVNDLLPQTTLAQSAGLVVQ